MFHQGSLMPLKNKFSPRKTSRVKEPQENAADQL